MEKLSKCCSAATYVGGTPGSTMFYTCTKCGKACDFKVKEGNRKVFGNPNIKTRHILKLEECFWKPILQGRKKSEVRIDDRDYQCGDIINFALKSPDSENFEPQMDFEFQITHVLRGGQFGISHGYVVLSIETIIN